MRIAPAALAVAATLFAADLAPAREHLVPPGAARARLSEAAAARARDLAVVERVLASPQARSIASALGADIDQVRAGASSLDDGELGDLAARAAALQGDPVTGDIDLNEFLVIFLIVAIVLLVLSVV